MGLGLVFKNRGNTAAVKVKKSTEEVMDHSLEHRKRVLLAIDCCRSCLLVMMATKVRSLAGELWSRILSVSLFLSISPCVCVSVSQCKLRALQATVCALVDVRSCLEE